MDIKHFVLVSGTFSFTQTLNQTISDGTAPTTTPLTGVTVQSIAISNLNLFVGVNGDFVTDEDNNIVLDAVTGLATIDTSKGTGFSVTDGNLELMTATETTGQRRSWMGFAANIGQMQLQGLSALQLEVQSMDLLYNGPDKTTGTQLNWAGIAGMSTLISQITGTTDISVSGTLYVNVSSFVIAAGTFHISQQSGLTVNDGNGINIANASESQDQPDQCRSVCRHGWRDEQDRVHQ